MSMYKDYIEEQLPNRFVYETEHGFLTYNINDKECQLEEIYIKPKSRTLGLASSFYAMIGEVAREKGCTYLKGSIVIGTNNAEISMKCLLKNNFKLWYTDNIMIYLKKELGE